MVRPSLVAATALSFSFSPAFSSPVSQMAMFALSSVLRAPRLGMRHKKDDSASLASPADSTAIPPPSSSSSSFQDDKLQKKRRITASSYVEPPVEPSVGSENSTSTSNSYSPRRSRRLAAKNHVDGDGDTWIECLVVNIKDRKRKTHKSRSLFYSIETQRVLW
ncbi:hypothetical protein HJC23_000298 [Cyclotella cryptica]|uniref:Uncharacterized protein n=1 Tax=Cyclotella cryptica TaxID=29204 RepID=A0ABD3NX16_9STRA